MKGAPDSRATALAVLVAITRGDDRAAVLSFIADPWVRDRATTAAAEIARCDSGSRGRALIGMTAQIMREDL